MIPNIRTVADAEKWFLENHSGCIRYFFNGENSEICFSMIDVYQCGKTGSIEQRKPRKRTQPDTITEDTLRIEINKYFNQTERPTFRGLAVHLKMAPDTLVRLEENGRLTKVIYQARLRMQEIRMNARQT